MKIFKDRIAAGEILAQRLKNTEADLVLGIPRGGLVVAAEIAKALKLPLDIIVTRKIGAPMQPELALGAVDPDGQVIWDNDLLKQLELKIENLKLKIEDEWKELKRREDVYRNGKPQQGLEGKTVILTDDGVATGATTLAAINYLKRHTVKKIILAVPVASRESTDRLTKQVDLAVILETPEYFQAVGQFYQNFLPVSDEEVIQLLMIK